LHGFLETASDIAVVGEAADVGAAMRWLKDRGEADVVLTDLVMPTVDHADPVRGVKQAAPNSHVIVLTAHGEADRVRDALAAGAGGFVLKSSSPVRIIDAIRASRRGELYLDPTVAAELARDEASRRAIPPITPRELEVIRLVARGKSNIDIANTLFISERTARTHVSHLLTKLDLRSRVQLALWAVENDVIREG
jgi:DNA-binding NarL/FixJ family response regulator